MTTKTLTTTAKLRLPYGAQVGPMEFDYRYATPATPWTFEFTKNSDGTWTNTKTQYGGVTTSRGLGLAKMTDKVTGTTYWVYAIVSDPQDARWKFDDAGSDVFSGGTLAFPSDWNHAYGPGVGMRVFINETYYFSVKSTSAFMNLDKRVARSTQLYLASETTSFFSLDLSSNTGSTFVFGMHRPWWEFEFTAIGNGEWKNTKVTYANQEISGASLTYTNVRDSATGNTYRVLTLDRSGANTNKWKVLPKDPWLIARRSPWLDYLPVLATDDPRWDTYPVKVNGNWLAVVYKPQEEGAAPHWSDAYAPEKLAVVSRRR